MALSATYSSAHQFIISGDQTNVLLGGRAFRADCGADGMKVGIIGKSVYSAPDTTVDVVVYDSDDLTANLVTIEVSNIKPGTTAVGNLPLEINILNRGMRRFVLPVWTAVGTLTITPGYIHVFDGNREKILTVEASFEHSVSSLTNETWYYIYLTCPANHSILITDSDISLSTTAPTYSETYKGWYNGVARCIGFFKSNSAGTMRFFKTDGFFYRFNNGTTKVACTNTAGTWVPVTLDIPTFAGFYLLGDLSMNQASELDATTEYYIRDYIITQAANPITRISRDGHGTAAQQRYMGYGGVLTIAPDKTVNTQSASYTITTYWNCNGIFLPRGMQCT